DLDDFAQALTNLKSQTVTCSICFNVGEQDPCEVCGDTLRDKSTICVVEQALDVIALEKNGKYKGVYDVLHGKIDPLNNIGPDEIRISELMQRVRKETEETKAPKVTEVILATNPTMEGEATAMYIAKQLRGERGEMRVTRIG